MVIEIGPAHSDQTALESNFNDKTSIMAQRLAVINELVERKGQLPLDSVAMEDRFEELFRAHGGAEYAFKQIAADVLLRDAHQKQSPENSPLIEGKAAQAINALRMEREKIISQLSASARNVTKLVEFEQLLAR